MKNLIVLYFISSAFVSTSQISYTASPSVWSNSQFNGVAEMPDGTVVICGSVFSLENLVENAQITQILPDGTVGWSYVCDGEMDTDLLDIMVLSSEEIIAVGSADFMSWMIKLSPQGELIWSRTYHDPFQIENTIFNKVIALEDGLLVGGSLQGSNANVSSAVMKCDGDGAIQWVRQIEGSDVGRYAGVDVDEEGFIYLVGTHLGSNGEVIVSKLDSQGNTLAIMTLDDSTLGWNFVMDVLYVGAGYISIVYLEPEANRMVLLRVNVEMGWASGLAKTDLPAWGNNLVKLDDGYALFGASPQSIPSCTFFDGSGQEMIHYEWNTESTGYFDEAILLADGGIFAIGYSNPLTIGVEDGPFFSKFYTENGGCFTTNSEPIFFNEEVTQWTAGAIVDLTPMSTEMETPLINEIRNWTLTCQHVSVDEYEEMDVALYPNPSSAVLNISSNAKAADYIITDAYGRICLYGEMEERMAIPVNNWAPGLYSIVVKSNHNYTSQLFVVE